MKILVYPLVAFAALIACASAQTASPSIPSLAQAQSALTGAQAAYADLVAAWNALQPVLSFIGAVSAFAATLPRPGAGSVLSLPRKLIDIAALAIWHAAPVATKAPAPPVTKA